MEPSRLIVFYDGSCPFCNGWIKFLLDRNGADRLRFAALESSWTLEFFESRHLRHPGTEALIVWDKGFLSRGSGAVAAIAAQLPGIWKLGRHLDLIPVKVREPLYKWVARNRYRWFGRREACWIPDGATRMKFLDLKEAAVQDSGNGDRQGND